MSGARKASLAAIILSLAGCASTGAYPSVEDFQVANEQHAQFLYQRKEELVYIPQRSQPIVFDTLYTPDDYSRVRDLEMLWYPEKYHTAFAKLDATVVVQSARYPIFNNIKYSVGLVIRADEKLEKQTGVDMNQALLGFFIPLPQKCYGDEQGRKRVNSVVAIKFNEPLTEEGTQQLSDRMDKIVDYVFDVLMTHEYENPTQYHKK